VFHLKGKPSAVTPLIGFLWNIDSDKIDGKINSIGVSGGFSPARYFPSIGYLALYKEGKFELWKPQAGLGTVIEVPDLKQIPNLYEFSPDGHWLLLGQIQTTSDANPSVVELKGRKFVDQLHGHEGTVLGMAFSRDSSKVVTACEDGNLRVFSTSDWKLLLTIPGHHGAVHRAEFTPNGRWIVSAGEDKTLRIWSAEDGSPVQTLTESKEPLVDLAISPDSRSIAASSEKEVFVWQRQGGD
jgi:WD40 repeat protein